MQAARRLHRRRGREKRAQNQPGTNNEYPNWRIPLADGKGNVVPLEELFSNTRLQDLAANHAGAEGRYGRCQSTGRT